MRGRGKGHGPPYYPPRHQVACGFLLLRLQLGLLGIQVADYESYTEQTPSNPFANEVIRKANKILIASAAVEVTKRVTNIQGIQAKLVVHFGSTLETNPLLQPVLPVSASLGDLQHDAECNHAHF